MLELGHSGKGHGDESLETAEASIGDLRLRKLPIIGLKVGRRPGYRAFGYATQQLTQRPMAVLGNSLANHVSGVGHFIATYRVDPSVSQRCDVKAAASDLDIEQKWKNAVSVSRAHVYAGMSGVQRIPPLGAQILKQRS